MQPPRSRTPRIDLSNTETLRSLILNGTAVLTTILLIRVATLLVTGSSNGTIPGTVQSVTEPIVWPFTFLPVLGSTLTAGVLVIDLIVIPIVAFAGLLIAGILTGWRNSETGARRYPAYRE